MTGLVLVLVGFVGMEVVSYVLHRWVMHGVGFRWHRSHHEPPSGRFERNDRFPLVFAGIGVTLFALGAGPWPTLWWLAIGVTAYGMLYLFVHEVFIHQRLPVRIPSSSYLEWLRSSHRDHHAAGGEPFGMLLPLRRDRSGSADAIDRTGDPLDRRRRVPSADRTAQRPEDAGPVVALDDDERRVHADGVRHHRQ